MPVFVQLDAKCTCRADSVDVLIRGAHHTEPLQTTFAGIRSPTDAEGHDMVHAVHIAKVCPNNGREQLWIQLRSCPFVTSSFASNPTLH